MLAPQIAQLSTDEGLRLTVYDDATGQSVVPGHTLEGHASIGLGRALDVHGISIDEAHYLLLNDIQRVETALEALPWFVTLDPIRQGVMINLGFNMGIEGLKLFVRMIADISMAEHDLKAASTALAAQDFSAAADELGKSHWATQVQPSRRDRLIRQLRTGVL